MGTQGRSRISLYNQTAKSRSMPTKRVGVLNVLGVFEWGPIQTATVCIDYADFSEKFGGLLASYFAPQTVKDFFDGGGRRVVINRIVHMTNGNPTSAAKATHTFLTDVGGTYGSTSTLRVDGLYYGTLGNRISIVIQDATNGEAARFDLLVYLDGYLVDGGWYRNLSMDDTDDRYVEDVINVSAQRSLYISVTDLDVGGADGLDTDQRPANITATLLTGGDDGLDSLATADYQGSAQYYTGVFAFNKVAEGNMLSTPDDTSSTCQNSMTAYCETTRQGKMLFLTDAPAGSDKSGIVTHAQSLTASEQRTTVLWPRIKIANPDKTIYGKADTITVPQSGMYAGRIAKNAYTEKTQMWTQPTNEVYGLLDGAVGLETDEVLEPTVQDYVTDNGVNPFVSGIREEDGNFGVWANDCLVGKETGNFPSIGEVMGVSYLRTVIEAGLQRYRAQGNREMMRREVKGRIEGELLKHLDMGAFASDIPAEAFYVNVDPEGVGLNNATVRAAQRFRVLVGLATAEPARFIDVIFTKDDRAVESYIQQRLNAK